MGQNVTIICALYKGYHCSEILHFYWVLEIQHVAQRFEPSIYTVLANLLKSGPLLGLAVKPVDSCNNQGQWYTQLYAVYIEYGIVYIYVCASYRTKHDEAGNRERE